MIASIKIGPPNMFPVAATGIRLEPRYFVLCRNGLCEKV